MIGKILAGAAGAAIAIGLAAPAGASPVPPHHAVPDFLAAAKAASIAKGCVVIQARYRGDDAATIRIDTGGPVNH